MFQSGAGVAAIKSQYILPPTSSSSSSSLTSSATSTSTSSSSTSTTTTNQTKSVPTKVPQPNTIRGRTKEQLGLIDHKHKGFAVSGINMDDVINVLPQDVMYKLRRHDYLFIEGTAEKGNRHAKGNKKKQQQKNKKRTGAPMHCYQFLKKGVCTFGDACRYKHVDEKKLKEMDDRKDTTSSTGTGSDDKKKEFYNHGGAAFVKEEEDQDKAKKQDSTSQETSTVVSADANAASSSSSSTTATTTTTTTTTTTSTTATATATANSTPAPTTTTSATSSEFKSAAPISKTFRERKVIDFHHKIYVAPLTTVGNLPFRRVMKDFGTDITCGEMAIAQNILKASKSEWALVRRHKCEDVFGIQIAGADHRMMDRLSQVIENEINCDFVDLNMGCPLDFICGKGMGSKLMTRVKRVKDIVTQMTSRLTCPMTLKLRTGWSSEKPMADILLSKIPVWNVELSKLNQREGGAAIQAVTIHGRSRLQRYKNLANWDFIRKCATSQETQRTTMSTMIASSQTDADDAIVQTFESTTAADSSESSAVVPRAAVIGNGDIYSFTDWNRELASGELDTCMLARGALIKPWLPQEIKEQRHWDISATERMDILKNFVKYGLEYWGSDDSGVSRCRRFLLEWQSFLHRYIPVGLLERVPHQMNERPPRFCGRNDLETLLASQDSNDWVKITEMAGLPAPASDYKFTPKHRANAYASLKTDTWNTSAKKQVQSVVSGGQLQKEGPPPMKKQKLG